MSDLLLSTLSKVLFPAIGIALMLFAAKRRKLSYAEDLGLRIPLAKPALLFLILWIGLIAVEELLTQTLEGAQVKAWPTYPASILALRILAIGILGPIAEELAFRGLLMAFLRRTRIGIFGAIGVTAALWSVVHFQYAPALLLIIFMDGVVLGLARHYTRSLYVPIAMHVMGNLFSVYQSLTQ